MTSAYDRLPLNALRVFEAVATRLNFGDAAEALHVTPAAVSQQIKALEDYLQTPLFRRSGSINLSVLPSFLQKWLTPRLGDLHARHPGVELHIQSSTELVDFARSDFHAAVRLGAGRYPGLHVEKLMDDWLLAVAAPRLLKKYGPLSAEAELDAR